MQKSWDGVALGLLALGYRKILYFEISCGDHGDWRSAYEADGEFRPACPRCGRPAEAAILAEGFTRRETIPWELVSQPLDARLKGEWKPEALPKRIPRHYTRRANRVTSSIGNLPAMQHSAS